MLKYVIEKLEDVEESQRGFYTEKDGKFYLNVDGIPENDGLEGLKAKANELLSEKKAEQQKRLALEAKIAELENKKPTEKVDKKIDDISAQLEDAKARLAEKETLIASMESEKTAQKIKAIARTEAGKLTKDASRLELLAEKIESRLSAEGDSVTVLDENGKPTISPIGELSKAMATKYPFLVDGKGATGGGAAGNDGGGGGAVPVLSQITDKELSALRTENPEMYKRVLAENK